MSSTPTTPTLSGLSNNLGSPMTPTTPLAPGVQQRLSLKQTAIDTWSMKEQLGLASAVLRSGDQNWVSVSRQMKPFSEDGRPQDWFSQKNCALQYNLLLGKVDTPRRKRGEKAVESVETPGEVIVRRLTSDRIKELRKEIEAETAELMQLEEECKLLSDEDIDEEKLRAIESAIYKEEKEEAERKAAYEKWLREREEKKQAIQAALKAHSSKLPLKGAAAAAVQQAGAARRASTQSERSSFSDSVDSPLQNSILQTQPILTATNLNNVSQDQESTTANESALSPLKKETTTVAAELAEQNEILEQQAMPHSPNSPMKSTEEKSIQDVEITGKDEGINGEQLNENDDIETKGEEEPEDISMADIDEGTDTKPDPETNEENVAVPTTSITTTTTTTETIDDVSQDDEVVVKEEVVEENNIAVEETESDADKPVSELGTIIESAESIIPPQTAVDKDATVDKVDNIDDDDDNEVIIKKELEDQNLDDFGSEKKPHQKVHQKSPRTKKISELSEEDCSDIFPEVDAIGGRSRGRDTRSKKISERSDEAEESPGPPSSTSRSTRRSKKDDTTGSNDGSTERRDSGGAVENKRLSRVKETETVGRGRRGSGATNQTTSRSSSPVGSGDESEADQLHSSTPTNRGSRARKKSGRGATGTEIDSAPGSPSPTSITEAVDAPTAATTEETSNTEEWKKCAVNVINELKSHKFADRVFSMIRNDSDAGNLVILRSTDISLIRKNIDNGILTTNTDLHHALHHLFLNSVMSLASDSDEHEMALTIYRDCITQMDEMRLLSLGHTAKSSPFGKPAKNREKRDSSSISSTPQPQQHDENKRKRSLEDTPVSTNKRRKR